MPRPCLRTFTLWTGTLLSLLIAAAFVVSARWWVWVIGPDGRFIGVHAGALEYANYWSAEGRVVGHMRHGAGLRFALAGMTKGRGVTLPLIYPFAAVAVPTLLAWRFWPKPPKPGHCPCGYDLTGNVSGTCPECGRGTKR